MIKTNEMNPKVYGFTPLHLVDGIDFVTKEEAEKINHILQKQKLSCEIVEVFEEFLEEKGIQIPCKDPMEEATRCSDDNNAKLYGTEYWGLIDQIHHILLADDKKDR